MSLSARSRPARGAPLLPLRRRRAPRPRDRRRFARAAGRGTSCAHCRRAPPRAPRRGSALGLPPRGPHRPVRSIPGLSSLPRRGSAGAASTAASAPVPWGAARATTARALALVRASGVLPPAARALVPPRRAPHWRTYRGTASLRSPWVPLLGVDPITVVCCMFKTRARDATVRRQRPQKAVRGVAQILEANL